MRYDTIADIYSANKEIRRRFIATMAAISEEEATIVPDGEKWSIRQIAEHLAMVDQGVARICQKLLSESKITGKMSNGSIAISPPFQQLIKKIGDEKVEAPERVQPTGNVSVSESIDRINDNQINFDSMRQELDTYDLNEPKFPHPYFGPISAVEWLVVAGGHELRHTKQIERLLERIRGDKSPG
jgi:hypothetical protein